MLCRAISESCLFNSKIIFADLACVETIMMNVD